MPNVHQIDQFHPADLDYHGEHIEIVYRPVTKDYVYHFSVTRSLTYDGHASSYSQCVRDAQKRVDRVVGSRMEPVPEHITPKDSSVMTDEEYDVLLARIRDSRLRAYQVYMAQEKDKQEMRDSKMRLKLAKQCAMLDKEVIRADKVIDALEKRINNIRVIQLTLGELDNE